ncbi:uncharacterized protein [Misgurnus anguillicaudatus]|uniref:uncharacterized protein isoform X6 n=1 Tax=Misgurnus anguillicaudatus TaxID=75329 RepID=UPI003CCF4827
MKHDELADMLEDELVFIHQRQLKSNLMKKYERVFEGIAKHGDFTLLNKIYTDLYITQGEGQQINTEHEVRQIEAASRRLETPEIQIECTHLFKTPGQDQYIRTVLTKGVAGIGKSVSAQKFVLDWAEGKENQDINFIFPLPFREMNLKEKVKQSLMDLISQFFPEIKGLNLTRNDKFKVLFIFDGLDECRLPLKFGSNEILRDVTSPASLDVLLTNLIKGYLLPSALIWITTRPAAAGKIPPEFIDRVTEVRGFNDTQKVEYFRKRFTDENMANTIIDHVKNSKSLFIMCHIPVFCWISATVLQNILEKKKNDQSDDTTTTSEDTPKTLTQMYTHFFRFQIQQSRRKYEGKYSPDISWDKDSILSLGKLAFQNLERNNLIFYDTDLEACGIDITKASVYSGMCTQIFKQETGIITGTMYCFVHMSIQEFTAALYAHLFLDITKKNAFVQEHKENSNNTMIGLLKTAVDKALESENGHLDLFLRFLLGLSLESNQPLLRGLLQQEESNEWSNKEIVEYIKQKFNDNSSAERSINLFYCLNELNDQSLVKEIQKHLREGSLSSADLSPAQWSALVFVLLTLEEEVEEFELQKFKKSDECLIRLSPVVKTAKKALLNDCNLTDKGCPALANVLGSDSRLKELNMSNNNLKDSGVKLICDGLMNTKCELEILRLSSCELTEESCSALSTVLSSDSISLKELDLNNNKLQDSGVKLLSDGLMNVNCRLEILRLSDCSIGEEGYVTLCSAVRSNPSHLIELDLSGNDPGESGVKLIYQLIQDQNCALKKVRVFKHESAERACESLTSVLGINPLFLSEINLIANDEQQSGLKLLSSFEKDLTCNLMTLGRLMNPHEAPDEFYSLPLTDKTDPLFQDLSQISFRDSEVKLLSDILGDSHCKLKKLRLSSCELTEESCSALSKVLSLDSISLKELNLSNNNLKDSGVKMLSDGLMKNCKLQILRLPECNIREEGYVALCSAVRSNPSHLTELDLSGNDPGESGVKLIYDLIQDQNCALEKVRFLKTEDAGKSFEWLSGVLSENPLLLTKLNLSDKKIDDSSVKQFCNLLKDKHCRFNTFILRDSCITPEGCADLMSGFILNPSHLRHLDLSGNKLEDSGMKTISHLLRNPQCKLIDLKLTKSCITAEGCADLMSGFNLNASHIRHLDLSGNKLEDSGIKKISHLLRKSGLQELRLSDCSIGEEGYVALSEALRSNPSHLTELDLRGNDPGESGVKHIYDLIQDQDCALKKVRFLKSRAAEEACVYLNKVLGVHPLLVNELNLSDNKLGDLDGEKLSALLMDSHSKVKKIILNDCELTEKQCSAVAALLSCVKEIEMNNSRLMDSGVKQICNELKKPQCQLQILKLSDCSIGEEGYVALSEALRSNPSHLIELDLSGNDPGESGVKLIYDLIQDPKCALKTVRLSSCKLTEESCLALSKVLSLDSISLKELNLSNNNLKDSGVKLLSDGLMKNCKLQILRLPECNIREEGYVALCSAVRSNPSHLIELDLCGNDPGESGVKLIHDLIQDQNCALKTVRFLKTEDAGKSFEWLSGVLSENPLLLTKLNLSDKKIDDSSVKQFCNLLKDKHCRFNTFILRDSCITPEGCADLMSGFILNPSHLRHLDLSGNKLEDSGMKKISDLLRNPQCKLIDLKLTNSSITAEGCADLMSGFHLNPSHIRHLDLSGNKLEDSGIKKISHLLRKCGLQELRLSDCSIGEEGYVALCSAVRSNPSHLIELDLSGNDPGESGVKHIYDLIQDPKCALKKVRFLKSRAAEEACDCLNKVLGVHPLLLKELNLSDNKLGDLDGEKLSALLMDSHSKVKKIILNNCELTEKQCSAVAALLSCVKEIEMNNSRLMDSGVKQICDKLKKPQCQLQILKLSDCSIGEAGYVALSRAMRSNPSHLIELDLSGNDPGESGVKLIHDLIQDPKCALKTVRFLKSSSAEAARQYLNGVVGKEILLQRDLNLNDHKLNNTRVKQICDLLKDKHCRLNTLILSGCGLTEESCSALTSVLISKSGLKELDMSNNNLQDSGVKKLHNGLENTNCQLHKLRLSDCSIGEEGYVALSRAVRSNPSHLIELDLSGNDPGESGVKLIHDLIQDQDCALKKVRFLKSSSAAEVFKYLSETLGINPLLQRDLNLNDHKLDNTRVKQISELLKDKHCRLNTLRLNNSCITAEGCTDLMSGFNLNPSHIRHLDLSGNKLEDSGMKKISHLLTNPRWTLKKLNLSDCSIGEEGYIALSKALRSNPSHLIELDLRGNDPGESGVKLIYQLIQDPKCALKKVRFVKSDAAEEACVYLNEVLDVHPLLLKELNLSDNKLGDLDGEKLSALLMDSHSKVKKIILNDCELTEKQCSAVAALLFCVKEIEMNNSRLMNSGVKQICGKLKNTQCQLTILGLSDCSIGEEGYVALCSAVRSNPSHLTELDLSGNDPGESGVKLIYDLIQDQNCALKTVRLLKSSSAVEGFKYLSETLGINPLLQRDLNLNDHKLNNTRVKQICDLLKDKHCRLNKLRLNNSCITAKGCADLMSAFNSNPSHIRHVDLSGNKLENSGMKKISHLLRDSQCKLMELKLKSCSVTENDCEALTSALNSNPSHLKELDLSENKLGDSGVNHLRSLLNNSDCKLEILRVSKCELTEESCSVFSTVLSSDSSCLIELDMSNNHLQDSGVKQLSTALENTHSKLKTLSLSDCNIREEGYIALCSALRSNPSHMIELDLSGNDPGESGVKHIYDLIQDQNCALKKVRLLKSSSAAEVFKYLSETLGINPLLQRDLNLNDHKLNNTRLLQICDLLEDKHCRLNTLMLNNSCITAEVCADLMSGFNLNPSHIRHLDLSGNKLEDSGMKMISDLLTNPQCRLEKLKLSDCSIGAEGYEALCSAVRSNPSHLTELDLSGNDPGESGVKLIYDLIQDQNCALKKVRLLKSDAAEEACVYLNEVLDVHPLLVKELNLSDNKLGDLDGEKLSALLMDSHSKVKKIILNDCELTEKQCSAVAALLSCVKEIEMNNSRLMDSGVKQICNELYNPQCQLQILKLSDCSIGEEGYVALCSAVRSNPSHLIELDLSGNDPGESGVKLIYDLIQDSKCALKTVRLLKSSSAVKAVEYLTKTLGINPLLQRDLNLNDHKLNNTRVKQICDLLKDKHCRLNTLMLNNSCITSEGCADLMLGFNSNPSHIRHLDLSGNKLEDSGMKKISHLLTNSLCKLQKLSLSDCSIGEEGYVALCSAVRSNPSHLTELDLSGNDPGESGVKLIYDLIQDPKCALNTVRLLKSSSAAEVFKYLSETLGINPLLQRELNLNDHKLNNTRVKQICDLLMDKHCRLNTLMLNNSCITAEVCADLMSAFNSNPSHIRHLDLSGNKLEDSGMKMISDLLTNPQCRLEKLKLSDCSIEEGGYESLSKAVKSNPSHLTELDLSGNDPGESGVKLIHDLIQDQNCALKKVRFVKSDAAEEACVYLNEVLDVHPLLVKELNLSDNKLGDLDGEKLSALLMDSHSKVKKIILNDCELTEKQCSAVAALLSCVKEIEMNNSRLMDSGVKQICDELKKPQCQLQILKLSDCSIGEEGYVALCSAVRSNPSHLIELDLSGNDPGESGVKHIYDLIQDSKCALKTVRLLKSSSAVKAVEYLTKTLGINPLLQRELNLNDHKLNNTRVKQICDLLKDKHCRLNTLMLNNSCITSEGCADLMLGFNSNPSHIRHLDLSGNKLEDSGMKKISHLLTNSLCKLQTLSLSDCSIGEEGYVALCSAVRSNPSHLTELDLSGNDPGESGVKLIYDLIQDPKCTLNTVRFVKSRAAEEACAHLNQVLDVHPLLVKELNLSDNKLGDLDGEKLSALLMDSHSKVKKIILNDCELTEKQCSAVAALLSCVKEIEMNNSRLMDSGVKQICDKLKNRQCQLQILKLSDCSIGEAGYVALSRAIRSNPSHLIELDLSGNDPGESGVKHIYDLSQNPKCALKKVRLLKSDAAEEACVYLNQVLDVDPLLVKELNLSDNKLGDLDGEKLSALLMDSHSKVKKIILNDCMLTEKQCSAVAALLSCVKEIEMNNSRLMDSGVKQICDQLKNPQCQLQILKLSCCSIGEEGYVALSKAVRSNPSHLTELDLRGNDPGESGVKLIHDLIQDPKCALKKVRILHSRSAEEAHQYLNKVVGKEILLQRDLNLNDHILQDSRLLQICDLLKDKHCRLNTLILSGCGLTKESCSALASVLRSKTGLKKLYMSNNYLQDSGVKKLQDGLKNTNCQLNILSLSDCSIEEEGYVALCSAVRSNPSHLTELDLSGNDPGESGVKLIYDLIQDQNCALKRIRLLKSPAAEEACVHLNKVLDVHPLLVKELNLSDNKLGDLDGEKLSALLMDSHSKVKKIILNDCELTEKQCSAVAALLFCVKEIEMNNSRLMDSGVKQICDQLKKPQCQLQILRLNKCELTEESCSGLSTVLSSDSISLKELDLSNNNLQDSGVKLLSGGLMNFKCGLKILRLSDCSIGEEGYVALYSALKSNPSHLIELDLSGNDPGESGVKLIYDLIQDQKCALKKVRLLKSSSAVEVFKHLTKTLGINPLLQRDLNLNDHKLNNTRVKQICDLLKDKHCRLNTLILSGCGLTEESCSALASVLRSKSGLKELDMSNNNLQDSGVKKLHNGLQNTNCQLHKLRLSDCSIGEEGYVALCSAVRSNPSHLTELDLSGNDPGESGVKFIYQLKQDQNCALKKVRLLKSPAAEEACDYLNEVLDVDPLLVKELNLSDNKLGDLDGEKLSALLMDSHSKVKKIILNDCELTEKQCSAVAALLSCVKEIEMNNSRLMDSGVKQICNKLKNPQCQLQRLKLSDCSIGEEGYVALYSAVRLNPSHLIELDLSGNDPGESGVKLIQDLIQDPKCALKKVRFLQTSAAAEGFKYLSETLSINPLLQRDLNLNDHKLQDSMLLQICDLMKDKHCRLNTLILSGCGLTEESCSALASVLISKSGLKELDMSNNNLQDSGVKKLLNGLENTNCQLHKLRLSDCSIGEEGYVALCSAIRSNPSHLIELDLSGNDPGESGVKLIYDLIQDQNCALNTAKLLQSGSAEEARQYLNTVVGKEILLQRELNLNDHKLNNTRLKQICDLLKDTHCRLYKLMLGQCGLKDEVVPTLISALSSNPSHLRQLDLSGNKLSDTDFQPLCFLLANQQFKLETLGLCGCSITEKQCVQLMSALSSNSSHLRELNLSENKLKDSGVKHLCHLLKHSDCKLEKLKLRSCDFKNEGFSVLASALNSNPSHLRHLDLSGNKLGNSGIDPLCDLLRNSQLKLETLELCKCSIKSTRRYKLISALSSNPSHLRELNLSGNKIKDSGLNLLCNLLKHSDCKLKKLSLNKCKITDVASLVKADTTTLKFLDLDNNKIKDASLNQLREVLKSLNCELILESKAWLSLNFKMPLLNWGEQSSSDEEEEDTSSQNNLTSNDEAEADQSTDESRVDKNMETPV